MDFFRANSGFESNETITFS